MLHNSNPIVSEHKTFLYLLFELFLVGLTFLPFTA
jgi:hypothetical protein